jgi:hypothetical protein
MIIKEHEFGFAIVQYIQQYGKVVLVSIDLTKVQKSGFRNLTKNKIVSI